jgi:hypothetical protein
MGAGQGWANLNSCTYCILAALEIRALVDVSISDTQFATQVVVVSTLFILSPKGPPTVVIVLVGSTLKPKEQPQNGKDDGSTNANNNSHHDFVCLRQPSRRVVVLVCG